MFYHLEGTVAEIGQNLVVLDCGGIGFALNATVNTISQLRAGDRTKLYIAEAIGENNFDLFGFAEKSEKNCFEMLVSVSGIGPKAALSILSYNTPSGLALAIMNNDVKALTVAPGIGKKIAQRIILELRDKLGAEMPSMAADVSSNDVASSNVSGGNSAVSDAVAALSVLGYSTAEIMPIIKNGDWTGMEADQIIRLVLKNMI